MLCQSCWNNLVTGLIVPSSLLQFVNSLFQTCANKFGTSSANTSCQQLVNRLVTTCLQICSNLCVFTCVVGLFILNHLGKKLGKKNIVLYRDDGLAIIKNRSARLADKTRKELHKVFEQFGPKITAESNLHVVNFSDVTFDLATGKYKPYRKPNDDPLYIHKQSNHLPSILRQLPASINKRISTLSSDKQVFNDAVQTYQNALEHSNFSHKLEYMLHVTQQPRRNRQRNNI